jgi:hypothetical protein
MRLEVACEERSNGGPRLAACGLAEHGVLVGAMAGVRVHVVWGLRPWSGPSPVEHHLAVAT